MLEIKPNTVNSVPREAKLEIDIRDIDKERRDRIVSQVVAKVNEIAKTRGVESTVDIINQDPPATCSDEVSSVSNSHFRISQTGTRMPGL